MTTGLVVAAAPLARAVVLPQHRRVRGAAYFAGGAARSLSPSPWTLLLAKEGGGGGGGRARLQALAVGQLQTRRHEIALHTLQQALRYGGGG